MTPLRRTARRADPSSGGADAGRRGADMRGGAPRTGAKRSLLGVIRRLPDYLRMLAGLMRDAPRLAAKRLGLLRAAETLNFYGREYDHPGWAPLKP